MLDSERFTEGQTAGFLHQPEGGPAGSVVLTHGAGSDCQTSLLMAVAEVFRNAGYQVLRCDLPFRQRRRIGPPYPSEAAADRDGLRAAILAMQSISGGPVCLGGHSYGGRQASILAAENPELVDRLLLLSYPLHPPTKPEELRTEHFRKLSVPALFVHGDADPFGTAAEMELALNQVTAPHRLSIVEKAGHDLKRGNFDVAGKILSPFTELNSKRIRNAGSECFFSR